MNWKSHLWLQLWFKFPWQQPTINVSIEVAQGSLRDTYHNSPPFWTMHAWRELRHVHAWQIYILLCSKPPDKTNGCSANPFQHWAVGNLLCVSDCSPVGKQLLPQNQDFKLRTSWDFRIAKFPNHSYMLFWRPLSFEVQDSGNEAGSNELPQSQNGSCYHLGLQCWSSESGRSMSLWAKWQSRKHCNGETSSVLGLARSIGSM